MKKFIAIALVLLLVFSFSGCLNENAEGDGKLKVVCTIFPQYDFVREIAGDKVDLKMLLPFGMESHDYTLESMSIADIKAVAEADLVIYTGGEGDKRWIETLKETVETDALWLSLTETTELLPVAISSSMQDHHHHDETCDHDHEELHEHSAEYDEHVWTSPKRAVSIVDAITQKLCELDSVNAEIYKINAKAYKDELMILDEQLIKATENKKQVLIFADRFSFRYLCHDYGLSFDAAFSGCSSTTDPTVAQINSLCVSATTSGAKVIFYMENSNLLYAEGIAERVGATAELLHSCHNVSSREFSNGATYLSLMRNNVQSITEALNESN